MSPPADLAAILRDLLDEGGAPLLDDRARLGSMLRERVPDRGRDIHLLLTALEAGVPMRLKAKDAPASDAELGQEAAQLVDQFGAAHDFARQAVEVWAEALGRRAGDGDPDASRAEAADAAMPEPAAGVPPVPAASPPDIPAVAPETPRSDAESPPGPAPALLPEPPELPAPSPDSTGPVVQPPEVAAKPESQAKAAPPARPLPPVQPLPPFPAKAPAAPTGSPAAVGAPPPIRPLPKATESGPGVPRAAPRRSGWVRWALGAAALVAIGIGVLALTGRNTAPVPPKPDPTRPDPKGLDPKRPDPARPEPNPRGTGPAIGNPPIGAPPTGGMTAEGFPIVDAKTEPDIAARPIEGDPNTLLFTFGLRDGSETYTYQAAVDFTRGDGNGVGLVKVFKGGRESATELIRTSRAIQSNGYLGFTFSGPLKGAVAAPNVCVSALVGRTPGRFDLANGGGLFCAFGTKEGGACDGDVKTGCGKLVPP